MEDGTGLVKAVEEATEAYRAAMSPCGFADVAANVTGLRLPKHLSCGACSSRSYARLSLCVPPRRMKRARGLPWRPPPRKYLRSHFGERFRP